MEIVTIENFTLAVWRSTVFGLILAYFDPLRLDPFRLQKKEIRQTGCFFICYVIMLFLPLFKNKNLRIPGL